MDRNAPQPSRSPTIPASDRTYVPFEQTTSSSAVAASPGVNSSSHTSWTVTRRSGAWTCSPARARSYSRRPPTLIAECAGGRISISPVNPASASRTAASVTPAADCRPVTAPSASSVSVVTPSVISAR